MSTENVFTAPSTNEGVESPATTPSIPDPVKDFVGEGKKYATVEEALKSIPHAQKHIETLKEQADKAVAEANKLKAERETYEAFMKEQLEKATSASTPASIDPTDVEAIVKRSLEREKLDGLAKANALKVREELVKRFGEKASEVFTNRGKELGVDLNALASISPTAVLELFKKQNEATPNTSGSVNTSALPLFAKPEDHKPVMFGADTNDLLAAWRRAKPQS